MYTFNWNLRYSQFTPPDTTAELSLVTSGGIDWIGGSLRESERVQNKHDCVLSSSRPSNAHL